MIDGTSEAHACSKRSKGRGLRSKMAPTHAQNVVRGVACGAKWRRSNGVGIVTSILMNMNMSAQSYSKFTALGYAHFMCFLFSSFSYPAVIEISDL